MIRVNLLAVGRERSRKRRFTIPAAHRVTAGAVLILLATVLGIGWWFWSLRAQGQQLDEEIARAEAEAQQLRGVLAEVQKFESRKAQLQQRVTLIEQLRKGQGAPVRVLDEISRSMPDRLWLSDLRQTGDDFAINGHATSLTALSDFVANLEGTQWFSRPVEIIDSQVLSEAATGDLVKFSIKATFRDPAGPAAATPARAGAAPGAG